MRFLSIKRLMRSLVTGETESDAKALVQAHREALLRERFIEAAGHDLINPLMSVKAGIRALKRTPDAEQTDLIFSDVEQALGRTFAIVADLINFERGQLGPGMSLFRTTECVEPLLRQLIREMRCLYPEHPVSVDISVPHPLSADYRKLEQLIANLLGNAFAHGSKEQAVEIVAQTTQSNFNLVVRNGGSIPQNEIERIWQRFKRGAASKQISGYGLGLSIVQAIAHAHDGTIKVASTEGAISFTFSMPRAATIPAGC